MLTSAQGEEPVEFEALFRAPPDRVFRAWTEPAAFGRWFGGRGEAARAVEIDLQVGGVWRCVFKDGPEGREYLEGAYTAIEPERMLAFTWRHVKEDAAGGVAATPVSEVTVRFEPEGAATRLKLRHAGILRREGREGVTGGWSRSFDALRPVVEAAS